MIKENIKSKMAVVKNCIKATGIRSRYKMTFLWNNTTKILRQSGIRAGVRTSELTHTIAINKKKVALGAATACIFVFCGFIALSSLVAYEYSYNGETLGIAYNEECVYDGIKEAEATLTEKTGADVVVELDADVKVKRVILDVSNAVEINEEEDVVNALTSIEDIKVIAYAINIAGIEDEKTEETTTQSIFLNSKANAKEVLDHVKAEFTDDIDKENLVSVEFEEDVKIEKTKVLLEDITTTQGAFKAIMTGGIEENIHVVKKGDSVADIAEKYGVSRKDLKKWNPEIKEDNILYLNQEIQLQEQIPLLNVITTRNDTINEDFGPEIEYEDTDNLYKGQEVVIKKGKSGNQTVNADIIEKNGEQIDRIDLSKTIHVEQKTAKVMRGTRERPETIGKGYYYYPMNGTFTSSFGMRWGRMHEGIDIAAPVGTDVHAADAGVVVESGDTNNGYGIAIKIDHGNGRSTYYAHNSKNLVKVGDTVYRGQHIAESGNTGSSTGPHLHFETRFNEVAKNPQKYL